MKMFLAFKPFGHSHMAFEEGGKLVKLQGAELLIIDVLEVR